MIVMGMGSGQASPELLRTSCIQTGRVWSESAGDGYPGAHCTDRPVVAAASTAAPSGTAAIIGAVLIGAVVLIAMRSRP